MNIIWRCFEVLVAFVAIMMAIGAMSLFAMSVSFIPYLGFVAIIIYLLVPKRWGVFGLSLAIMAASIYLAFMFLSSLFGQPFFCLMSCILSFGATVLMLRGKPLWVWGVIAAVFMIIGVWYVFNNDIVGPMEFMIRDRPIDTPAQWYHCYRFFWAGIVIEKVAYYAGIVSVPLLLIIFYVRKACERLEGK